MAFISRLEWVGIGIILLFLLYLFIPVMGLPLIGDEIYYAHPSIMNFHKWYIVSFGHPPLWMWLNSLIYLTLGYSVMTARILGILFSILLVLQIYLRTKACSTWIIAGLAMFTVIIHRYFLEEGALNQPVIAAALFGFLSLYYIAKDRPLAFALCNTLALCLRESSLAYTLAATVIILMQGKYSRLLWLAPPVLSVGFFYLWSYLGTGEFLLNPHYVVRREEGGFDIFNISQERISFAIFFYSRIFLNFGPLCWPLVVTSLLALPMAVLRSKPLKDPIFIGLMVMFLVHSLFFAFYADYATRDAFESGVAFVLMIARLLALGRIPFNSKFIFPVFVLLSILLFWYGPKRANIEDHLINYRQVKEAAVFLRSLESLQVDILASNPINEYLMDPNLGYLKQSILVRYYGGVSGPEEIGNPDIIIDTSMYGKNNEMAENLRSYIQNKDFFLIKDIASEDSYIRIYAKELAIP